MMDEICRLCLREGRKLEPIVGHTIVGGCDGVSTQNLAQLIFEYLSIQVTTHEDHRNALICVTCRAAIEEWHWFHGICLRNDEIYQRQQDLEQVFTPVLETGACNQEILIEEYVCSPTSSIEYSVKEERLDSEGNEPDCDPDYELDSQTVEDGVQNVLADKTLLAEHRSIPPKSPEVIEKQITLPSVATRRKKLNASNRKPEEIIPKRKVGRPKTRPEGYKYPKKVEICTICGKQLINMEIHMRRHNNDKRFKCPHCPWAFLGASHLKNHMNVHTKEIKYNCDQCGKQFLHANSLKQHLATHAKERSFVCPVCGKGFYQRTSFSRHKRAHFEKPSVKCPECDKLFMSRNEMQGHYVIHLDARPHVCAVCNTGFRRRDHLKVHLRTHGIDDRREKLDGSDTLPSLQ